MTALADLQIKLDMESAKFRAEIEKVQKSVGSLESRVTRASNTFESAFKFTAAAVAARALYGFVKAGADASDQTKQLADSLDLSVAKLSGYEYAAKQSGAGTAELHAGLRELAKGMAEAAAGSKEAQAKFNAMGINVQDTGGKIRPIGVVFEEIADKFAEYGAGAAKGALANEVFGRSGFRLVGTLSNGKQGLKDLSDQATKTGRVLTDDVAAGANLFNDALDDIRVRAEVVGASLASKLAPALVVVSKHFSEASQRSRAFSTALDLAEGFGVLFGETFVLLASVAEAAGVQIKGVFKIISAGAKGGLSGATSAFEEVKKEIEAVAKAYEKSVNDFFRPRPQVKVLPGADKKTDTPVVRRAKDTTKQLASSIAELQRLEEQWDERLNTFGLDDAEKLAFAFENDSKLRKAMADVFKDPVAQQAFKDERLQAAREFVEAQKSVEEAIKANQKAEEAERASAQQSADVQAEVRRAYESLLDPVERYREQLADIAERQKQGKLDSDQADKLRAGARQELGIDQEVKAARDELLTSSERYAKELERIARLERETELSATDADALRAKAFRDLREDMSETERAAREVSQNMFDAFADNLFEGFDKGLAAMGQAFLQTIARMAAEAASANLLGLLFGDGKKKGSGLLSGLIDAIPGRAVGGPVAKGRSYLVGEEGPELFSPSASGAIIPADQTAALLASRGGAQRVEFVLPPRALTMTLRDLLEEQYASMVSKR